MESLSPEVQFLSAGINAAISWSVTLDTVPHLSERQGPQGESRIGHFTGFEDEGYVCHVHSVVQGGRREGAIAAADPGNPLSGWLLPAQSSGCEPQGGLICTPPSPQTPITVLMGEGRVGCALPRPGREVSQVWQAA